MKKEITHLISAQLKYLVFNIHSTFLIVVGIITYSYLRNFNPINLLSFAIFIQFVSHVLLTNPIENRDYIIRTLTLSAKEVAFTRVVLVFSGFIIIYTFFGGIHYLILNHSQNFRDSYHEFFMFGGLALSCIFFYLFVSDFYSSIGSKSKFVWFNLILGVIVGISVIGISIAVKNAYDFSLLSYGFLIILLYLSALIFAGASFKSYQNRESYLGYK